MYLLPVCVPRALAFEKSLFEGILLLEVYANFH